MTEIRYIDTKGLPKGYDIADLVASGITGENLKEWCAARVRNGVPPARGNNPKRPVRKKTTSKPKPQPAAEKSNSGNVVALKKPEPDEDLGLPPEYSEDSLAEAFSEKYDNSLLYIGAWGTWMLWEDERWQADETGAVLDMARKICKVASAECQQRPELGAKRDRIANKISQRKTFGNVEAIARTDRRHAAVPALFDADPWVINTPDGVVDLKTGQIRPARREDYVSKSTAVGPGKPSPAWQQGLKAWTDGDEDLELYLQRMAGYCLTGSVAEHVFFFCYGTGGNGKGTFINTLDWILNSYSRVSQMDTFTEQRFAKHAAEIAFFQGARLVSAQETEEGKRWHESRIKAMTGGDPITANWMHKNPFTFHPTFKLLFSGNNKPSLRNVDEAMKRRLHIIPFDVQIPPADRDPMLPEKLKAEAPGILQWAIDGCLEWQRTMLCPPARVLAVTEEYFEREDVLGVFFQDCLVELPHVKIKTTQLYETYCKWSDAAGEYTVSRKRFLDMLAGRGYYTAKISGEQRIEGLGLQDTEQRHRDRNPYND